MLHTSILCFQTLAKFGNFLQREFSPGSETMMSSNASTGQAGSSRNSLLQKPKTSGKPLDSSSTSNSCFLFACGGGPSQLEKDERQRRFRWTGPMPSQTRAEPDACLLRLEFVPSRTARRRPSVVDVTENRSKLSDELIVGGVSLFRRRCFKEFPN